jgi:hypothetical protein
MVAASAGAIVFLALRGESGSGGTLAPTSVPITASPRPRELQAPPQPPVAPRRDARVHVTGTGGAEILVDGNVVGNVPADLVLPGDASTHELVVQRSGYGKFTRSIALTADTDLRLEARLARLTTVPAKRVVSTAPRIVPAAPKSKSGGAAAKLSDPFADEPVER